MRSRLWCKGPFACGYPLSFSTTSRFTDTLRRDDRRLMIGRIQRPKSRILVNSGSDRKHHAQHEVAPALERVDLGGPERRLGTQEQRQRHADRAVSDESEVPILRSGNVLRAFLLPKCSRVFRFSGY